MGGAPEARPRIVDGRVGFQALGALYASSVRRLSAEPGLRASLTRIAVGGIVVSVVGGAVIAHGASPPDTGWALIAGAIWWFLTTAVLVGGTDLLVTPEHRRINGYGVPNALTALRAYTCLPLILCAALPLGGDTGLYLWCAIGMPAGLLDFVDGYIARRVGPITELGKALDPLGDAVFFGMAAVGNVLVGIIPIWLGAIMLLRYSGPLLATPVVFLLRRRPELVHTEWGRRNTLATGLVLFVGMIIRLTGHGTTPTAIVLGIPLLVTTTLLHFATLWRRVMEAPTVRPRRRDLRGDGA